MVPWRTAGGVKVQLRIQVLLVAALAALALTAQDGRKGASGSAILHPEMTVQTGTYDKPAATLGVKPVEPWTATTIEAAVNKAPNPGKPVTIGCPLPNYFACILDDRLQPAPPGVAGELCLGGIP